MSGKCKILLTIFSFLLCFLETSAQDTINLKNTIVRFSNTKLTVKNALNELGKLPAISINYNTTEDFLKLEIVFSSRTMNAQSVLNEIMQQAPVDISVNINQIEVKCRQLEESYTIHGTVRNAGSGEILITANVFIEGTKIGTITDIQGHYSLRLKPGKYVLVSSFMGFREFRMPIYLFQNLDLGILLEVKQLEIDEVKIAGNFREIESLEKGRSIENIGSKIMSTLNTNDVNDALHGRLPGVWTTKVSGAPGDHNKIRIRGINSIFGSSDPLYVVDGMIIPVVNLKTLGISDLNSHDVENISVLKDASSTALYGFLGGNGVILIETKKGGGKSQFNFNVKQGVQTFSKRYNLMDAETFLSTLDSSDRLLRTAFLKINPQTNFPKYPRYIDSSGNALGSDNYQDEIFRNGHLMEYQLSGQGSIKKVDYYISGNYYKHDGIIINSNYNKYTLTGNFSKNITEKISLRFLYRGSHQENENNLDNYMGNNVIFKGINYEPAYRYTIRDMLFEYNRLYFNSSEYYSSSQEILSNHLMSPEILFNQQKKNKNENVNSGILTASYKINEDLSARILCSLSFRNSTYTSVLPFQMQYLKSDEGMVIFDQKYELNYKKQFKNYGISAFILYRDHRDNTFWNIDSIQNIEPDGMPSYYDIYLRGSQSIYGVNGSIIRSVGSGILNFNLDYKKKYFISLISNYDHLREGHYVNQREFYPSVAVDWDLSKEAILKIPAWINSFNLFVNWGQSGNYPLNSLSNDLFFESKYFSNGLAQPAISISNLANHYIKAEKVSETNYGVRISLLRYRIKLSADYYSKTNSGLLVQRKIPLYYGAGYFMDNIGEMKNTGIECGLELIPIQNANFHWSTRAGFSTSNQKIVKLNYGVPIKLTDNDALTPDFILSENVPLGSITGYSYHGLWNNLSVEEIASKLYVKQSGLAYLKGNTLINGKLSDVNKTIIGNALPDNTFNWTNRIEYKHFSWEMFWYAVIGCDKYNATKASTYATGVNADVRNIVLNKLKYNVDQYFYESSYFVEDASFIRLKTLNFSYSPTRKIAKKIGIEYTLSFENIITLTHYSGYDPESTIYTDNNFTDNAIDRGAYPNPRGTYISINLKF